MNHFLNVILTSWSIYSIVATSMTEDDIDRNITQIIESRGFEATKHEVETSDGYILGMFRLKNPNLKTKIKLRPIILQHGMSGKAENFLLGAPGHLLENGTYVEETGVATDCSLVDDNSVGITLTFVLSSCGYDVWLSNFRGNRYSRKHITKDPDVKGSGFWNFTMDSYVIDLSSMINYVRNLTSQDKVSYVGHSLGTTSMFELLSSCPEFNIIIEPIILLSPVAYSAYFKSILKLMLQLDIYNDPGDIPFTSQAIHHYRRIQPMFWGSDCFNGIFKQTCKLLFKQVLGYNPKQEIPEYTTARLKMLDDTSFKLMAHIAQNYKSNKFAKYDYKSKNMAVYGQNTPPLYDLSKITSPNIIFISSDADIISTLNNTNRIRSEMTVKPYADYVVPDPEWTHFDFVTAKDAGKLVNSKILKWLKDFEN